MIIENIHLQEGFLQRDIEFSDKVNLIFSQKNSVGKTTLLRLLLYGLGYDIPNTRHMKFNHCVVAVLVRLDSGEYIKLVREQREWLCLYRQGKEQIYTLPEQQQELHEILFHSQNQDILNNILGTFYVDQEKGWTLLNRGKVIGDIRFNIEELIRGLSDVDTSHLAVQRDRLEREVNKYTSLLDIAEYNASIEKSASDITEEPYDEQMEIELATLETQMKAFKKELQRIDKVLAENQEIRKFISQMNLMIETPSGEKVTVTEDNVLNLDESVKILVTKWKFVYREITELKEKINKILIKKDETSQMMALFHTTSEIDKIDRQLSRMDINIHLIQQKLQESKKQLKVIKEKISETTRLNNKFASDISSLLLRYAQELDIDRDGSLTKNYIYTSNLKELTGAMLHKMAFAFRLAYIKVIQKKLNILLPIILDSPRGREVDKNNAESMMKILKRDFSENQIIIASIFKYDTFKDECRVIELKNKVIE